MPPRQTIVNREFPPDPSLCPATHPMPVHARGRKPARRRLSGGLRAPGRCAPFRKLQQTSSITRSADRTRVVPSPWRRRGAVARHRSIPGAWSVPAKTAASDFRPFPGVDRSRSMIEGVADQDRPDQPDGVGDQTAGHGVARLGDIDAAEIDGQHVEGGFCRTLDDGSQLARE